MCLSQRPFTKESIEDFADQSLAAPATLVSDGLGCFKAVRGMGILQEPHVTGSGAAGAKHLRSWPPTRRWETSRRRCPAPVTPSASGRTRIVISAKCSTCSTAGSTCARFWNAWPGWPLRLSRVHFAPVLRLDPLADQDERPHNKSYLKCGRQPRRQPTRPANAWRTQATQTGCQASLEHPTEGADSSTRVIADLGTVGPTGHRKRHLTS